MRVNVAVPEAHVTPPVLDAALEATTRLNETLLRKGVVPTFRSAVERVRWKPEPPGDEHFDHAAVVLGRGWGDCDDLAPWHAASLRATGEDPGAEAFVHKSGPNRWHAVVRRSDGSVDDPSKEAGMGQTNGVIGGALPLMMQPSSVVGSVGSYIVRPQLALRPVTDRQGQVEAWQARADLPWHWAPGRSPSDIAMVSLHASPVSSQAVVGACQGLIELGEANDVDEDILDRAAAIADGCEGASYEDLEDEYGPEHAAAASQLVGSFFKKFGRTLKRTMKPKSLLNLATKGIRFVPGVGPVASIALEHASPMLQRAILTKKHKPRPKVQRKPNGRMVCVDERHLKFFPGRF